MISPRFRDVNPHDMRHSHLDIGALYLQWEFQDPKLEVPTIYKAYFLGLFFRPIFRPIFYAYVSEYHHKIWPKIWY